MPDFLNATVTAPGFSALLKDWLAIVGFNELHAQLPALLAGLTGPPLLYLVARRLGFSRPVAGCAGLLLVMSPAHSVYSSRVKPFTFDTLLAIGLFCLAFCLTDEEERASRWTALVLASSAAFMFSATAGITGLALIVVCGGNALLSSKRAKMLALWHIMAYGIVVGAWYFLVLSPHSNDALREFWQNAFISLNGPLYFLKSSVMAWPRVARIVFPGFVVEFLGTRIYVLMSYIALIAGFAASWRILPGHKVILLAAPGIIGYMLALSQLMPLGGQRTDLYMAPMICIFMAMPAHFILLLSPPIRKVALVCVSIFIALGVILNYPYVTYPREDLKTLTHRVETEAGPSDRIVVYPETSYMYALYSNSSIGIIRDPLSMTGFTPTSADPRVTFLPGFEFTRTGPIHLRGERKSVELLRKAADEVHSAGGGVWIVLSTYFSDDRLPVLVECLQQLGFTPARKCLTENAEAVFWERA